MKKSLIIVILIVLIFVFLGMATVLNAEQKKDGVRIRRFALVVGSN